jgi:hypothetical protein
MVAPSAREHFAMSLIGVCSSARLAHLDEHGVLGEAAHVHDEGLAVLEQRGIGADVMDTGWPPPVLLVTVIMPNGMRWPCSFSTASTRARSMLPLNG